MEELMVPAEGNAIAVGNDLVHLPDFIKSCTPLFIRRVFTSRELEYCDQFDDRHLRYASTWAAKEAVYKCIKQINEDHRFWWRDIEVIRDKPQGKPVVSVPKFPDLPPFALTISHDGDYVWAIAIATFFNT
jgi:phosphopantetheine--protein transferase-like protein